MKLLFSLGLALVASPLACADSELLEVVAVGARYAAVKGDPAAGRSVHVTTYQGEWREIQALGDVTCHALVATETRVVVATSDGLWSFAWSGGDAVHVLAGEEISRLVQGEGSFLALAGPRRLLVSSNGRTWAEASELPEEIDEIAALARGAGRWVLAASGSESFAAGEGTSHHVQTAAFLVSADGREWGPAHVGEGAPVTALAYGAGKFLALDAGLQWLTSPDGHEWSASGTLAPFAGKLQWDGRRFWLSDATRLAFSPDGLTWTDARFPDGALLQAVVPSPVGDPQLLMRARGGTAIQLQAFATLAPRAPQSAAELFAAYDAAMLRTRDLTVRVRTTLAYLKSLRPFGEAVHERETVEAGRRVKRRGTADGRFTFDYDGLYQLMYHGSGDQMAWIQMSLESADAMIIRQMGANDVRFGHQPLPEPAVAPVPDRKDPNQTVLNFSFMDLDALRRRAFAGDRVACAELFQIYLRGRGALHNPDAAVYWKDRAERLGWRHGDKLGVEAELAAYARQGSVFAVLLQGIQAYGKKDPQAVGYFEQAIRGGAGGAALFLGGIYEQGECGQAKDPTQAARWYEKGLELGYVPAGYYLAEQLARGEGVPGNPIRARELFRRAAEAGHPFAMDRLATMLRSELGGAADPAAAAYWRDRARAEGMYAKIDEMIATMEKMNEINDGMTAAMAKNAAETRVRLDEIDAREARQLAALEGRTYTDADAAREARAREAKLQADIDRLMNEVEETAVTLPAEKKP